MFTIQSDKRTQWRFENAGTAIEKLHKTCPVIATYLFLSVLFMQHLLIAVRWVAYIRGVVQSQLILREYPHFTDVIRQNNRL